MGEPISWGSPPDTGKTNWRERLTPLLQQPGRWANWEYDRVEQARMAATMINHRRLAIPKGKFIAKSISISGGGGILYVMYEGPDEDESI